MKFEYTGNARVPCWIVRVPKDIIWEHGGLWSDNSARCWQRFFVSNSHWSAARSPRPNQLPRLKARIYRS